MKDLRTELREEIELNAVHFGQVTLSSGATSDYYINCRQVTLSPRGAWITANVILDLLADTPVDAVGGMTLAADPIAAAVAIQSWVRGTPLRAFIVRKETKGHGLQKQVEGPIARGDRVAIVDDVLTTGGSIVQAIEAVEALGAKVETIVVLLDRLQGGSERLSGLGYRLQSVLTIDDLREYIERQRAAG